MGNITQKEKLQAQIITLYIKKNEIQEKRELLLKQLKKITGKNYDYKYKNDSVNERYEKNYDDDKFNEQTIENAYLETEQDLLVEDELILKKK